ncbi:MAG: KEOPS complex kinase/ATPase Bud32 [Nanoarchaeota archaeon]
MPKPKEIARGAEAVLYASGQTVVKVRPKKGYRIPEIDLELRKRRTRQETVLLQKLEQKGFPAPRLISSDMKERIVMEKIPGTQVKETLDKKPGLAKRIGELVGQLHNQGIIHADLTTSNMILDTNEKIHLIDFGLSYHSQRIEDKAVDLHLFLQALESRHFRIKDRAFTHFLDGYRICAEYGKVLKQLKIVEKRGRNKEK